VWSVEASANYLFTMLIRTLFFALLALAIAISGYAQMPATPEPSAPPANRAPIRSSRKLVPAQSVAAAKTPVGTPSESPSPPATVAPPQRKAGPGGQPVPDQDTVSRLQIFLDEHSFVGQERSMDVGASFSERRCNVSKLPMANNRPARSIRL
jgi:hypothetical protein